MGKVIRRKRKAFKCGVCGRGADEINPSKYSLKDGIKHKPLCTVCSAAMIFSALGNYEIRGEEIRLRI